MRRSITGATLAALALSGIALLGTPAANAGPVPLMSATMYPVCANPQGLAISPDGGELFVACPDDFRIREYDSNSGDTITPSYAIQSSPAATALAVSNDGHTLFSVSRPGDFMAFTDTETFSSFARFGMGAGNNPSHIAVSPGSDFLWVSDQGKGVISIVNVAQKSLVGYVTTDTHPSGIAINRAGDRVYVANLTHGTVSIVDTGLQSGSVHLIKNLTIGGNAGELALAPNGGLLYVTNGSKNVAVIDTNSNQVIRTFVLSGVPFSLAVSADSDTLYATENSGGAVLVIDALSGVQKGKILTGGGPLFIVANPKNDNAYADISGSGSVVVIAPPRATRPHDQTVAAGKSVTFETTVINNPDSVQWQLSADSGNTWHNVNGGDSSKLTFNATKAESGNLYRIRLIDSDYGNSASDPAKLTVTGSDSVAASGKKGSGSSDAATNGASSNSANSALNGNATSSTNDQSLFITLLVAGVIVLLVVAILLVAVLRRSAAKPKS